MLTDATTSPGEKWLLRLKGRESELQELCKLGSQPDWRVAELEGNYYLTSREFDSLEDPREVRKLARDLLGRIAGAAKIVDPHFASMEVASVERVEEGRPPTQFILFEPVAVELTVRPSTVPIPGGAPVSHLARVSDITAIAGRDDHVATALYFWGKGQHNWHSLYKVYENVKADVGSRIWKQGWASRADVERFTRTAQSREAAGDEARHSLSKYRPPVNPMSLREAQSLVGRILDKWLRFKSASNKTGETL